MNSMCSSTHHDSVKMQNIR